MAELDRHTADGGMSSIIQALSRNPIAAAQLIAVIIGGIGVYYTLSQDIATVKSEAVHDRADIVARSERRQKEIDTLNTRAEVVETRQTVRYGEINTKIDTTSDRLTDKLNTVNSKVDKLDTNIEWIIRQLSMSSGNGPAPARGAPSDYPYPADRSK